MKQMNANMRKRTDEVKAKIKEIKPKHFLFLTIAGIINAFGVTLFLFPVKLYDSGISGTSMLLDQITLPFMTLPLFLILLNVPVFIFGYRKQGFPFTVYSVFTVGVYFPTREMQKRHPWCCLPS